jgi:hypothetical protein
LWFLQTPTPCALLRATETGKTETAYPITSQQASMPACLPACIRMHACLQAHAACNPSAAWRDVAWRALRARAREPFLPPSFLLFLNPGTCFFFSSFPVFLASLRAACVRGRSSFLPSFLVSSDGRTGSWTTRASSLSRTTHREPFFLRGPLLVPLPRPPLHLHLHLHLLPRPHSPDPPPFSALRSSSSSSGRSRRVRPSLSARYMPSSRAFSGRFSSRRPSPQPAGRTDIHRDHQ